MPHICVDHALRVYAITQCDFSVNLGRCMVHALANRRWKSLYLRPISVCTSCAGMWGCVYVHVRVINLTNKYRSNAWVDHARAGHWFDLLWGSHNSAPESCPPYYLFTPQTQSWQKDCCRWAPCTRRMSRTRPAKASQIFYKWLPSVLHSRITVKPVFDMSVQGCEVMKRGWKKAARICKRVHGLIDNLL